MESVKIVQKDGYLIDANTEKRIVFYECYPAKNTECDKQCCRNTAEEADAGLGFCTKTMNPAFRKNGGRAFYAALKDDTYWGREYIEGDADDKI